MRERATTKLFWDADRTVLVEEADPRARFLACAPGDEIPVADEHIAATVDGHPVRVDDDPIVFGQKDPAPEVEEAEAKEADAPENKKGRRAANKAG